jgi:hypothetical protein
MAAQFDSLIQAGRDPSDVVSAVRASAARVACVVHGDPSILRYLPRLVPEDAEKRRQLLAEVVSFAFSEEFAELRRGLGGPLP